MCVCVDARESNRTRSSYVAKSPVCPGFLQQGGGTDAEEMETG